MSAPLAAVTEDGAGRWCWPVDLSSYDTTPAVRAAEAAAISGLGAAGLRRLGRRDTTATGSVQIGRLARPLDDAGAALESPLTAHRRRAMLDASAVVLLRCARAGRSYWAWTEEEWISLLGRDQCSFRMAAPSWADDASRPYLAAHAFLLGRFSAFGRLGRLNRLALARQVFGRDRVDGEIVRVRSVLADWGYRLGSVDQADLRRLGRGSGPDDRRRLCPAHRRPCRPHRQAAAGSGEVSAALRGPDVLPGLPGMGMAAPPVRPPAGAGHAAQRRGTPRPEPARDRRRNMGQAAVGRPEP